LKIRKYPDPILLKKTVPVKKISLEIFTLVEDMIETMLENEGIGLAANQVNSLHRIFVINSASSEKTPNPIELINPEIIDKKGLVIEEEGCLSFPQLYLNIPRPEVIRIHAKNLYNESIIFEVTGLLSRAVMHEMDHLNGILFIEHVRKEQEDKVKNYIDNLSQAKQIS
jgi:peptide deformylase